MSSLSKQEAQLSQRNRAMLRVIEYFDKSFKITQGHSKWYSWLEQCVSPYKYFIVTMPASRTIFELFYVEQYRESWP